VELSRRRLDVIRFVPSDKHLRVYF